MLIWFAKDLLTKDRRSIRVNVPFDNAKLISWSPDCTAFIVSREEEKVLEVFKMGKKAEGSHVTVNSLTKFKKVCFYIEITEYCLKGEHFCTSFYRSMR